VVGMHFVGMEKTNISAKNVVELLTVLIRNKKDIANNVEDRIYVYMISENILAWTVNN
jgi:hypothetical protein